MSETDDDQWGAILERIRSLRFPPDEFLDDYLAHRLDAILDRRRRLTSFLLAVIAEHTGASVDWLLTGREHDDPDPQCWHYEPGSPCDWNTCHQLERLAAGDFGTEHRRWTL